MQLRSLNRPHRKRENTGFIVVVSHFVSYIALTTSSPEKKTHENSVRILVHFSFGSSIFFLLFFNLPQVKSIYTFRRKKEKKRKIQPELPQHRTFSLSTKKTDLSYNGLLKKQSKKKQKNEIILNFPSFIYPTTEKLRLYNFAFSFYSNIKSIINSFWFLLLNF